MQKHYSGDVRNYAVFYLPTFWKTSLPVIIKRIFELQLKTSGILSLSDTLYCILRTIVVASMVPLQRRETVLLQLIAAMTRSSLGTSDVPRRLKRHFAVVQCTTPHSQLLDHIFTVTAARHFNDDERGFAVDVRQVVGTLVQLTRTLWDATKVSTSHPPSVGCQPERPPPL